MRDLQASQKVMKHYLNALLTEDEPRSQLPEDKKQQLASLLAPVTDANTQVQAQVKVQLRSQTEEQSSEKVSSSTAVNTKPEHVTTKAQAKLVTPLNSVSTSQVQRAVIQEKAYRKGRFQTLFFSVAGLKIALPLKELGGIHKLSSLNSLPGQPKWLQGVMMYREQKINVVDTAQWVMPEKYTKELSEQLNYQYVIMLGNSQWGLACDTLVNTLALEQDDVKWRETEGKRPWLAGLIKEHMCALLDVESTIDLLAKGLSSQ